MSGENVNARLEAFCDGVFAIALTLLIIEIRIPPSATIQSTNDLWIALKHILPSIFTFVLSFTVILITWVNHHAGLKLVHKSSPSFIYANGFLLLTVVFVPFPTSLLGNYLLTDHAAPAVVLYDSVLALIAVGWILITRSALSGQLLRNEKAAESSRQNGKYAVFAFALYSLCAILAFWFPLTIAIFTTLTWVFWLILGITLHHE
jgi:uncharacterized membrane protein